MRRWSALVLGCAVAASVVLGVVGVLAEAPAAGFTDRADGYSLAPPAGWSPDASRLPDVARWDGPGATLRVYVQPVKDGAAAADYVGYSNRSVDQGWNGLTLLDHWQRGQTWYRRWERPAMPLLQPDEREYAEWDQALPAPDRVVTFMVNATPAAFPVAYAAAERAWRTLRPLVPHGQNGYELPHAPARPAPLVLRGAGLQWGLYEPSVDMDHPDLAPVQQRDAELGYHARLVLTYRGLGRPFPTQLVQQAWADGRIVELTLQSWSPGSNAGRALPYSHGTSALGAILKGSYDDELRAFARAAAAVRVPFFFRWDNEMNGDWDPWSAFQWGKDTDLYVAAWRHVYGIFQQEGATNAVWVWNPNNDDLPPYRWNVATLYYPGDDVVDWVGLTGYNRGGASPGDVWRSFDQTYGQVYQRDLALYPGKPLMITEFASHDAGGDKAAWIRGMFAALVGYPAIHYAVWWDADEGTTLRYRLDQPPAALGAFRDGLGALR